MFAPFLSWYRQEAGQWTERSVASSKGVIPGLLVRAPYLARHRQKAGEETLRSSACSDRVLRGNAMDWKRVTLFGS